MNYIYILLYFFLITENLYGRDIKILLNPTLSFKKMSLRNDREPLLLEADYKINTLVDNGSDASAWRKYRQELRDITKAEDLGNVTFPTKPS